MLSKLQKKTLVPAQVIGYGITLLIGVLIILTTSQLYFDMQPMLQQNSEVFKSNYAIISKNVTVFKTADKGKLYFSSEELQDLRDQPFVKDVAPFKTATFKIRAFGELAETMPVFYADLFFESIPNKYLNITAKEWQWDSTLNFIPIVIPEDYLNLYNFGFAESQGLPVLSKNTISQLEYNINLSGNGIAGNFKSKIVGYSTKINSILVPQNFIEWANSKYGSGSQGNVSRVLIDFSNPSDEGIVKYFNQHNYDINKEKLEFSKLMFFFQSALLFVFIIAVIIVILSIAFIMLSVNLIIQKNKELFLNLYTIGYGHKIIARFYQIIISTVTVISITIAIIISSVIRGYYMARFGHFFQVEPTGSKLILLGLLLTTILVIAYNLLLIKNIKKAVAPKR